MSNTLDYTFKSSKNETAWDLKEKAFLDVLGYTVIPLMVTHDGRQVDDSKTFEANTEGLIITVLVNVSGCAKGWCCNVEAVDDVEPPLVDQKAYKKALSPALKNLYNNYTIPGLAKDNDYDNNDDDDIDYIDNNYKYVLQSEDNDD